MSYAVDEVDPETAEQLDALPHHAALALTEAVDVAVLELTPWSGEPINTRNSEGPVRMLAFGTAGLVTYLVLEDQRRVDLLRIVWAEP